MAVEQTFAMIKPDTVARGETGRIIACIEAAGFTLRRMKIVHLSAPEAQRFYQVHEGKPFLEGLVAYISSGPVCAMVLEREDAIAKLRELVGATDPAKAAEGTIRKDFGLDVRSNAIHASDGPGTARDEIAFFGMTLSREA
jgi:nucleoside-diphosphate kinase